MCIQFAVRQCLCARHKHIKPPPSRASSRVSPLSLSLSLSLVPPAPRSSTQPLHLFLLFTSKPHSSLAPPAPRAHLRSVVTWSLHPIPDDRDPLSSKRMFPLSGKTRTSRPRVSYLLLSLIRWMPAHRHASSPQGNHTPDASTESPRSCCSPHISIRSSTTRPANPCALLIEK